VWVEHKHVRHRGSGRFRGASDIGEELPTEVGPAEDMFMVYEGRLDGPLDRAPVWRYVNKDALRSPNVPAVAEFRKIIEEAEKQQKRKP